MSLTARLGMGLWALVLLAGAGGTPAAPPAAPSRPTFTWDVPRVLESVEVPGVLRADGVPVKLRSVKSAERPEVILQHLVDRFEQAGFFIPPDKHRTQWFKEPQLTALDPERLISYTFVLQPNPDGTTTVILGEANLGLARREKQAAFAPLYPGAADLMRSEMEGARMLTYLVTADVAQVQSFYGEHLRKAGFSEDSPGWWKRGGEELRVAVRPAKAGRVVVILQHRAAPERALDSAARQGPQRLDDSPAPAPAPGPKP